MTTKHPPSQPLLRAPLVVTVGALLILFSIAYVADSIRRSLADQAGETFSLMHAAVANIGMPFLVIIMVLALAWLQLSHHPRSPSSAGIVLLTGIFFTAVYMPFLSFPPWLRETPIGRLRAAMWSVGSYSSLYFLAASCVVIGAAALLKRSPAPSKWGKTD